MNVFSFSPSILSENPQEEKTVGPLNIPFDEHCDSYALADEKSKEILEAENKKVDELMNRFTRGFDPGAFIAEVMAWIPELSKNLFPSSYSHLFVLLLETHGNMEAVQINLEKWLQKRYQSMLVSLPANSNMTDQWFFLSELEMLRKLLAPLRGEDAKPIIWMNSRRVYGAKVCQQLEASARVIEEFKRDVVKELKKDTEDNHANQYEGTCYSSLPVSTERSSLMSMKQLRIDACRATLNWDGFNQSDIELTSFYHFYKDYIIKTEPAKARASGWLPPLTTEVPHSSAEKAKKGDLVVWPSHGCKEDVLDLLLKTALWLSVARGLAPVHLFCDVARLFTIHKPSKTAGDTYVSFLRHLTQMRISDGVQSHVSTPVPYRDVKLARLNPDYFDDVWKTNRTLTAGLTERLSLLEKKTATDFKMSAPPTSRSLRKEKRTLKETRGGAAVTWPTAIPTHDEQEVGVEDRVHDFNRSFPFTFLLLLSEKELY
ncbi:hypothetical protein EYZ11_006600 [Aspergillus tanneri]|uniref:Uncharacterized protein n=1 Tax=Aspergillus tanneri TaxID=1220188 RepID=A0A4S3JHI2_9EURO|nr:hypothetical protein EYZ11_006600 [Aspergillus tanneri]